MIDKEMKQEEEDIKRKNWQRNWLIAILAVMAIAIPSLGQATTVSRNVTVSGTWTHHENVVFEVPEADTWAWQLGVHATNGWRHKSQTRVPPGWSNTGNEYSRSFMKSDGEQAPWRNFQTLFEGTIVRYGEGKGGGGSGSDPGIGEWRVDAVTDSEYFVLPTINYVCVGKEVTLTAYSEPVQDPDNPPPTVNSTWEINKTDGITPNPFPVGDSVTFTASKPDEYTVKGESTSDTELTDSAMVTVVKVEFKTYPDSVPGPDKPHVLNMDTRQNEEDHYIPYKKCVSHVWSSQPLDLAQYLDGYDDPDMRQIFYDVLKWRVNGGAWQDDHELSLGGEPDSDEITRFNVEVTCEGDNNPKDYLILTVVPPATQTDFNQWHTDEGNDTAWLAELPALYSTIFLNQGNPQDPEPGGCNFWKNPDPKNTLYHPDGHFEMRSTKTAGNHGHQAIYSDTGGLIRSGVSAGSADREAPFPEQLDWRKHVNADVKPFIWAAQMDGNPVEENWTTMSAPILHEGVYLGRYFEVRPAIANANPELAPGTCP